MRVGEMKFDQKLQKIKERQKTLRTTERIFRSHSMKANHEALIIL